jgi:hypothetical protein
MPTKFKLLFSYRHTNKKKKLQFAKNKCRTTNAPLKTWQKEKKYRLSHADFAN